MSSSESRIPLDEVYRLVQEVPPTSEFLPLDDLLAAFEDLAGRFPGSISRERIGTSRRGEPLWNYRVGAGSRDFVILGGVHPNEPFGGHTALHLARLLLDGDLADVDWDARWNIIPCIDPDGLRLNEGWFAGPFDRAWYSRRFYRPEPSQQVEWTFPFSYGDYYFDQVIPETLALMRLFDRVEPAMLASLHNGEFGGVYYYLGRRVESLLEPLQEVPRLLGVPLDVGEPESPVAPVYGPAIFGEISPAEQIDYLEKLGVPKQADMMSGDSTGGYLARYGSMTIVPEVPYWSHPRINDLGPSTKEYGEVLREAAVRLQDAFGMMSESIEKVRPDLTIDSPIRRAAEYFVESIKDQSVMLARAEEPAAQRVATLAEAAGAANLVHMFRLRFGGMLLRSWETEIAAGTATHRLREEHKAIDGLYARWAEESERELPGDVIPFEKLIGVQLGAVLLAARSLDEQGRSNEQGADGPAGQGI